MARTAAEVIEAALALPDDQRASLAEQLLASLDGPPDADPASDWNRELQERLARIDAGHATSISIDESLARLHRVARGG